MNEKYDSRKDTERHIEKVRGYLDRFAEALISRGEYHDSSKLTGIQKACFDENTPKLKTLTYGSKEYKKCLDDMNQALEEHYSYESHHPEHFKNGISGMNLLDLVEMFLDWMAATERHADGDIYASIEHNKDRFNIPDELADVFENTAELFGKTKTPCVEGE